MTGDVIRATDRLMEVVLAGRSPSDPAVADILREFPMVVCTLRALGRGDVEMAQALLQTWAGQNTMVVDVLR